MTPKEFLDENYFSLTLDCKREIGEIYQALEDYADYVLKAKLESVRDEEMDDNLDKYEMLGAKWLKQKLLNNE